MFKRKVLLLLLTGCAVTATVAAILLYLNLHKSTQSETPVTEIFEKNGTRVPLRPRVITDESLFGNPILLIRQGPLLIEEIQPNPERELLLRLSAVDDNFRKFEYAVSISQSLMIDGSLQDPEKLANYLSEGDFIDLSIIVGNSEWKQTSNQLCETNPTNFSDHPELCKTYFPMLSESPKNADDVIAMFDRSGSIGSKFFWIFSVTKINNNLGE